LRNAALLKSVWGNKGDFFLARPAAEVTLLDIVETVDGPVGVMDCVLDPKTCDKVKSCDCFSTFCAINKEIVDTLKGVTLGDVVSREKASQPLETKVCERPQP
jgi:Rrf2 family protein